MGVSFDQALTTLDQAVAELFRDARVRSVGIGSHMGAYGYHVVRKSSVTVPLMAPGPHAIAVNQVPVTFFDRDRDVESQLTVPASGPGSPGVASMLPEQGLQRPLACGLQIQNYDDDVRMGRIAAGHMNAGTLGCFVRLQDGQTAILSNNHVVAGGNRGQKGVDRIMQSGSTESNPEQHVATLTDFVSLSPSPLNGTPINGTAVLNTVDGAVATVVQTVPFGQSYLGSRHVTAPAGTTTVKSGVGVYKVGRSTGLTFGEVTSVVTVVGPIKYPVGTCWFSRSISVVGVNGTTFSDHGDSGAAVLKVGTGEVVGILYASNGTENYACPIDDVLSSLHCSLI